MNIKENLLRMKDLTELMQDLAYSAVFLRDREIADKVKEMHKEVSMLEESTLKMLFRVKEPEDERMFIVDLLDSIKDMANASLHIAELSEGKRPDIIKDIFRESNEKVITAKISAGSPYAKKTIGENAIRTDTGATIIGIKRKDSWIFNIDKDTKMMPGDEVIAVGTYNGDRTFKKRAQEKKGRKD
ncbi:MAG: TrkA C-terminal domain-containing protein [Candidatus Woesearchaeota archaeon]